MEYATEEAYKLVDLFTTNHKERESIRLYLSEIPIGDEYQILTETDWLIGKAFIEWCGDKKIKVFEDDW